MIENSEQIFKHMTQGVYVISVKNGEQENAFTAAWVMQVSFDPLLICFSINPEHYSYQLLKQGAVCCISVLDRQQLELAAHYGQSSGKDKMAGHKWLKTETGTAALANSLAYFDCRVDHYTDAGDHKLAICKVIGARILNRGTPMTYADTEKMDKSSELYQ